MANSVGPVQTAPEGAVCTVSTLFASILNSSVMLGNYLQQTTSADNIFRCFFFLGALRVESLAIAQHVYHRVRAQWLGGRVLDLRLRGCGFEPHRCHCVVSLSKKHYLCLVLVQPIARKTRPDMTEKLLTGT